MNCPFKENITTTCFFLLPATYIQPDFIFSNIFQRYCTYFLSNTSFRCISDTETIRTGKFSIDYLQGGNKDQDSTKNRIRIRPHKTTALDCISLLTYLRRYCNSIPGIEKKKIITTFFRNFEFSKKRI